MPEIKIPSIEDKEVRWILVRPCFTLARIARRLHDLGLYKVEKKAEDEQACAIHWMLNLYGEHGEGWRMYIPHQSGG